MARRSKGKNFQKILVSQTVQGGMSSEEKQEEIKRWNQNNKLLASIEENTRGMGGGGDPRVAPDNEGGVGSIGVMGAMLAAALGTLVGAIQGHIAAIKFFGEKLLPKRLITGIGDKMASMKQFFGKGMDRIMGFFRSFSKGFGGSTGGFKKITDLMTAGIASVKNFFAPITEALQVVRKGSGPITRAVNAVKSGFSSIKAFFGGLGKTMGAFSKVFSGFAAVAKKIFLPITVVMTLWDTVKGAFAGFEEGGIVGGFTGAIEGFVNSLISAPLDLLKNGVSWILEKFGFENASAALDSFSFEELFSNLMDGIRDFIKAIPDYFMRGVEWLGETISSIGDAINENLIQPMISLFNEYIIDPITGMFDRIKGFFSSMADQIMSFVEGLGIPAITFSIPLYGDVTLGPWYPFRDESQAEAAATSGNLGHSGGVESTEDLGNGDMRRNYGDGSYSLSGAEGTVGYDADGNEIYRRSISMNGYNQTTFADGSTLDRLDNGGLTNIVARDSAGATVVERNRFTMDGVTFDQTNQRGDIYGEVSSVRGGSQRFSGDMSNADGLALAAAVDPGYAATRAARIDAQSVDNQIARTAAPAGGGNTTIVNAPVSSSSSTTAAYRPNIRNQRPQERAWYDIF
jgi:hypothetical protein